MLADRYRLIELAGRGGMAEVWRAEDVPLERPVAIKIFDPAALTATGPVDADAETGPATVVDRVRREARGAARLIHPNVVRVYDVAADGDHAFLVMELVDGPDLARVLARRGPLPPVQVAGLGAQAARALAAAHTAGLVHGDVKPGNLLLADDGTLKLTDFGIARPLDVPTAEGTPETVLGTAGFVAPEQAVGRPGGPASDLYALGCVLYELLTGQPPFNADTPRAMLRRHLDDTPAPPSALRPQIPAELERIVLGLLAKDPATRPADATQVAEALETISRTSAEPMTATRVLPGQDRAPSSPDSEASWLKQHPLRAVALAATALIVTVTVGIAVAGSGDTPTPAPPEAAAPTTPQPTRTSAPEGTTPPVTPGGSAAALAALRQRITQQADSGRLDRETAGKVSDQLRKIDEKLREGKAEDTQDKIAEIRGKLREADRKGEWTPDPTTLRLLDQLSNTL
jgi:serine/threonine protein kinase